MEDRKAEFPITSIRVCLDATEPDYSGKIVGIALEGEKPFSGKEELMRKIGEAYREIGQPQPHLVSRSFSTDKADYDSYVGNPQRYRTSEEIHDMHGCCQTYDLIMISRKHAEWQGIWKNVDGTVKASFETMLECLASI